MRPLGRHPRLTLGIALLLGLGIGSASLMFTVADRAMLRPLPYPKQDRLVWLGITWPGMNEEFVPGGDYLEWSAGAKSFEALAANRGGSCDLTGVHNPERIRCASVTPPFFQVIGILPAIGRGFTADEALPAGQHAVILTHGFARRLFSDPLKANGAKLLLNGDSHTVVGVMPESFRYPGTDQTDVLVPWKFNPARQLARNPSIVLRTIGRLKPGVTVEQARSELETYLESSRRRFGWFYRTDNRIVVRPLLAHQSRDIRTTMLLLLGAVGVVLLISCANVANLQLARAAARWRELAVRQALGATRSDLFWLLIREGLTVGLLGGLAGLAIGSVGLKALVAWAPEPIPGLGEASLDVRVLMFAIAATLVSSLLFSLAPAVLSSRARLYHSAKPGGGRMSGWLVAAGLGLSLALLVTAGSVMQSLWRLQNVELGFERNRLLTARITLPGATYPNRQRQTLFWDEIERRVARIPGVEGVSFTAGLPPQERSMSITFTRTDRPRPKPGHRGDNVSVQLVSPAHFRAMGIRLLQGRLFDERDRSGTPLVAVVNDALAARYFQGENPIGHQIMGHDGDWKSIAGVVADVRNDGLRQPSAPEVYYPIAQQPEASGLHLVIRTESLKPESLIKMVQTEVRAIDPNLPLAFHTMKERLSALTARPRLQAALFTGFAGLALLLSAVGAYGVLSYSFSQRTHEFGIRRALGAESSSITSMVLRRALQLALAGIVIGLAAAWTVSAQLQSLLFEIKPLDTITLAAASLVLLGTALAAAWLPARRASQVDPLVALRLVD